MGELIAERSEAHTQSIPAETHDEDGGRHHHERKKQHAKAPTMREERCDRREREVNSWSHQSIYRELAGIRHFVFSLYKSAVGALRGRGHRADVGPRGGRHDKGTFVKKNETPQLKAGACTQQGQPATKGSGRGRKPDCP